MSGLRVTFLGSGTSTGVPVVGCSCGICRSDDPRNNRLRQSALIETRSLHVIIDTTPDLRAQLLRRPIPRLDAVLFTHSHSDHMMGLDDVRPFNFFHHRPVVAYANENTARAIRRAFSYIWDDNTQEGGGKPQIDLRVVDEEFEHDGLQIIPVPVRHGDWTILGWRIGRFAYVTDTNGIPDSSYALLEGVEVLALDGLRMEPRHSTHFTIEEAIEAARPIGARETWLMHLSHDVDHALVESKLPPGFHLAYDMLELDIE